MSEQTYVYGEVEVKMTGRTATRPLPGGKEMVVNEITPADENDGTWKKWVMPNALLTIKQAP